MQMVHSPTPHDAPVLLLRFSGHSPEWGAPGCWSPPQWEDVTWPAGNASTETQSAHLWLGLRLSVLLLQDTAALGKAIGLHSMVMSPPT